MSFMKELADPMSTCNTSRRFFQEQRDIRDTERRAKVNKELEKALSSSSEDELECKCKCKCKCKAEKLTPGQIAYRRDLMKRLEKLDTKFLEMDREFYEKHKKQALCTIL